MESLLRIVANPSPCGYLPDQTWQLEYEYVGALTAAEYLERMRQGWRRFGHMLFHPRCPHCTNCLSLRVVVERFRPDRSQRRACQLNEGRLRLHVGTPFVNQAKLSLYDRYHAYQTQHKAWPEHAPKDEEDYERSFVENPFPTQEWSYFRDGELVGVGYVDDLPGGLSAIYFYYDPEERGRSLGTWNVLSIIEHARQRGIPHVYLGYYVPGCNSMEYKARFVPNQVLGPDGTWHDFKE